MDSHEGTISLCMIVRDEEHNLGRCLDSARGFVNEIIVVDTGSRDATPDIARHYGARLYDLAWQDDFSQARNESLKHAIGEWVLILDADEELPPETAHKLRFLAAGSDVEAWAFTIISPCSSSQAGQRVKHPGLRMFKNRESYFFEGKIHEQIIPSILRANPGATIPYADAAITHHGYTKQSRNKTRRNISILKQALAERPADSFINYNLGLSYYALSDLESSRRYYEAARTLIHPNDRFAAAFFRNYSICLGDLGDYEQALKLVDEGLACFPDYPDLYFIKGQLCWDLSLLIPAKANFLKCLRFRQTLPEYVTTEGVTDRLALQNLAEVCARDQNFDEAVAYLERVLKISPTDELFVQLCVLLQKKGLDGGKVASYLKNSFHLDRPVIARLLFGIKEYEACLHFVRSGERQEVKEDKLFSQGSSSNYPGIEDELLLEAKCLLRLGHHTEAAQLLSCCTSQWPIRSTAILEQHFLALWLLHPRQNAGHLIAACGHPDDPPMIACQKINSLLFSQSVNATDDDQACSAAPLAHARRSAAAPDFKEPGAAVTERILRLALEALLDGDSNLSLTASLAVCWRKQCCDAYLALGKHALSTGYSEEALQLLEYARKEPALAPADTCYLLGTACANLDRHGQAFLYFTEAGAQDPGNELYAACALEQLAGQCLVHLTNMLALEDGRADLRNELFRVTSLRHKMQHLKQDLLHRDQGNDSDATATQAYCSFDAGSKPGPEDESRKPETTKGSMESQGTSPCESPGQGPDAHRPGPQADLLSIVMPVCAGPEVTQKALQAIADCTDCPYEIIIVDNDSNQICKAIIAEFENRHQGITRVICNDHNRGYPAACNQGLQISRGKYAVVMNNDVLVTPHWASRMSAAFSGDPRIGIVGPRTNYVFGEQLVRECVYNEITLNEWSQQWYGRHTGSRQSAFRLVGFLMMIRQELIKQIGGFDPIFGLGNFDDDDYCLRARLAGYRLVIANDVFVHHYGSQSFNKQPEIFSRLLETNKRLFAAKWGLKPDFGQEETISGAFDKNELYIPLS